MIFLESSYESDGCWNDGIPRTLASIDDIVSETYGHYKTRSQPIQKCFDVAKSGGYKIFALQDGGYCYGSIDDRFYKKYGNSTVCVDGKGGPMVNSVYRINEAIAEKGTILLH